MGWFYLCLCLMESVFIVYSNTQNTVSRSVQACDLYYKDRNYVHYQINNGDDVKIEQYPFMAALGRYNDIDQSYHFDCGASLISDRFLVTAAHCYQERGQKIEIARLGVVTIKQSINRTSPSRDFFIKRVIVHEKFESKENLNDIALVELKKSVSFSTIMLPICLNSNNLETTKDNVTILGWGGTGGESVHSNILQKATVNRVPPAECQRRYDGHNRTLQSSQICAAHETKDTCRGDSGGPLLIQDDKNRFLLMGITSYGHKICGYGFPTIYTKIESYLDWIEGIVWPNGI